MKDNAELNQTQTRNRAPWYYRPITGRDTQFRQRSERLANGFYPLDRLEEIHQEDGDPRLAWQLTHCVFCGVLVGSVVLDSGVEHYADLQLDEAGELCAVVGQPHGCNRLFAAYALAEADEGQR